MIGLLRLDGRNAPVRMAAIARVALVPVLILFEALETQPSAPDLWFTDSLLYLLTAYAIAGGAYAFLARRELPLMPFAVVDTLLLALIMCGEGGTTSDVRYMLFVPVLVAVLTGPRLTLGLSVLSVVAYVAASVVHPAFAREVPVHVLAVHTLDLAWRAAVAVVVAILL